MKDKCWETKGPIQSQIQLFYTVVRCSLPTLLSFSYRQMATTLWNFLPSNGIRFNQTVDHFGFTTEAKFQQKYLYNDEWFVSSYFCRSYHWLIWIIWNVFKNHGQVGQAGWSNLFLRWQRGGDRGFCWEQVGHSFSSEKHGWTPSTIFIMNLFAVASCGTLPLSSMPCLFLQSTGPTHNSIIS